jgi:methylthioribose-1-phosphate isomerase
MNEIQHPQTLRWVEDSNGGHLVLIDQTVLPQQVQWLDCHDVQTVWEAIRALRVRGAPAIGIAAAYGVCLGMQPARGADRTDFLAQLDRVIDYLAGSRPTAVNLFWALRRMRDRAIRSDESSRSEELLGGLIAEAKRIHDEDRAMCHAIGRFGADLLADGTSVLTHCNAGGLATAEYGTALAVFFTAQDQGKRLHVFVDETRPLLQGARLTAWELMQRGIPCTLICDSMAGQVMREGRVQAVVAGADRIAANGDTANKIGTYSLAVLAEAHGIPFYIAAPTSTFDLSIDNGDQIPIEQRAAEEITMGFGRSTAPEGVRVYNPAFDVTPARYIRAIITERGLIAPVDAERIRAVVGVDA